jgi:hypothetical protein
MPGGAAANAGAKSGPSPAATRASAARRRGCLLDLKPQVSRDMHGTL